MVKVMIMNEPEKERFTLILLNNKKYKETPINDIVLISIDTDNELKDIEIPYNLNNCIGQNIPKPPEKTTKDPKIKLPSETQEGVLYDPQEHTIYIQLTPQTEQKIQINKMITLGKNQKKELSAIWIKLPKEVNQKIYHNQKFLQKIEL